MATEGHLGKWVNLHGELVSFDGYEVERRCEISLSLNIIDMLGVDVSDSGLREVNSILKSQYWHK